MRPTSKAHPGLAIRDSKLTGRTDDVSLGVGEAELTFGRNEPITLGSGPDSAITCGSASPNPSAPLLSAIEAIRAGNLAPPTDLRSLLTQAVAARESRRGEDVTAWSQRLADEAARADS